MRENVREGGGGREEGGKGGREKGRKGERASCMSELEGI